MIKNNENFIFKKEATILQILQKDNIFLEILMQLIQFSNLAFCPFII